MAGIGDYCRTTWVEGQEPSSASLKNAAILLDSLVNADLKPEYLERGYWPATIFVWADPSFDVEVFDDSIELNVRCENDVPASQKYDPARSSDIERLVEVLASLLASG